MHTKQGVCLPHGRKLYSLTFRNQPFCLKYLRWLTAPSVIPLQKLCLRSWLPIRSHQLNSWYCNFYTYLMLSVEVSTLESIGYRSCKYFSKCYCQLLHKLDHPIIKLLMLLWVCLSMQHIHLKYILWDKNWTQVFCSLL